MSLIVSVSGVRGVVGESLTPSVVMEFALAYGSFLNGGRVALARDSRPSGEMFAAAAAAGLTATGCEITDLGIAMTPTIGHAIRAGKFKAGLSITASHNPGQWNGLKLLDDQGLAPDAARAARVAEIRERREFKLVRDAFAPIRRDEQAGENHMQAVLDAVETDLSKLRGLRVVLDCINGAGSLYGPEFLRRLGCDVIAINGEPNGRFAHTPEPTAENLTGLCDAVKRHAAAIGFAQDPDADRLAIVDEAGRYVGEEYTLALAAQSVLSRRRGPAAANLSTSRMIDDVARSHGVTVFRTPVGEAHVARAILANQCVIGGEGNGGVIDPRISPVRDSLTAMGMVLQLMAASGKRVGDLVAGLPRYTMLKQKFECESARAKSVLATLSQSVAKGAWGDAQVNNSDGVRVDTPEGWVHLRSSNTEPIIRVIAEAADVANCQRLISRIKAAAGV